MKKKFIMLSIVMIAVTIVTMCGIGVWSNWYSSPPGTDTKAVDAMEMAVVGTWCWLLFIPTVVVVLVTWVVCDHESMKR